MLEQTQTSSFTGVDASPALVSANMNSVAPKVDKLELDAAPVAQFFQAPAGWSDKLGRPFHPSLLGCDCLC